MTTYLWNPPAPAALRVQDTDARLPVHRLFFVGRNYHAHAQEMGVTVDKATARPFYFTKSPVHLLDSGATLPYPPETTNFHYEMELVVVLGQGGARVPVERAHELIYGYAAGLDMTRRDVQLRLRDKGHPWCLGKDVEGSAVCGAVRPMPATALAQAIGRLWATGRFSDIAVRAGEREDGVALVFATRPAFFISLIGVDRVPEPPNVAQLASSTRLSLGDPFDEETLAAAAGKPVLIGPHTWNFEQASRDAIAAGAARKVKDAQALAGAVRELYQNTEQRQQMGQAGRRFAEAHRGATERILRLIEPCLAEKTA